ncbi:peptidase M24, structural domain-containing protein [Collybia nuda]|uniref:Peptidase M24, structural domain-containing protein n=1 Tax=Collybia nuda TaxID=64659 RepID=A0A9P6CLG8_9AGAR|nr:peptidase M24, structural domain-containing protein [Collybia nuda]
MKLFYLVALVAAVSGQLHPSRPARYQKLPSLRERARIQDVWRDERVSRIPSLLEKYNADAWLMSQREHAEDTIWWSIKNATDFGAHRRTILMFHRNTASLKGQPNPLIWIDNTGDVWPELRSILKAYDPNTIVLNTDRDIAFGSGLHVGELAVLEEQLGKQWMSRVTNEPHLSIEFVATRVDGQLHYYRKLQEIVWAMLEEGFSHRVIKPGLTTTEDLEWWFRERMQTLNVTTWNQPRISVIVESSFPGWEGTRNVIQEGDLLHIDYGITALGLNTDTQHMAYVLRTDPRMPENDAPESLKEGMKKSNRMQDIVLATMRPGLTGNEVLRLCLAQMEREGIEGQIFSHPIGDWGHDAGAVMGFTNLPKYVPVLGELTLLPDTYYSIELYAYHFVPERNETLRFRQEENAYWSKGTQSWRFVRGRQEKYHLIDGRERNTFIIQT